MKQKYLSIILSIAAGIVFGLVLTFTLNANANTTIIKSYLSESLQVYFGAIFNKSASSDKQVIITNTGKVGIGTTGPTSKLDIASDVTATNFSAGANIPFELSGFTDATKNLLLGFETENNYGFVQTLNRGVSWSTYNLALQPKGGKVGIGTTAPGYKLHLAADGPADLALDRASADVSGNFISGFKSRGTHAAPGIIAAGDDLLLLRGYGYDGASNREAARITMDTEGNVASTQIPGRIMFYTATDATPSVITERMRINSAGNVGIGTTDPGIYKLKVDGDAEVNDIYIKSIGKWVSELWVPKLLEEYSVYLNSKTNKNCNQICQENGGTCVSIGTNLEGTNSEIWRINCSSPFDCWCEIFATEDYGCTWSMFNDEAIWDTQYCGGQTPEWSYCRCKK